MTADRAASRIVEIAEGVLRRAEELRRLRVLEARRQAEFVGAIKEVCDDETRG